MGMTPLHIMCANPAATKDMIKQLYIKNAETAAIRNANDMLPWHLYEVNKDKHLCMFPKVEDHSSRRLIIHTTLTDTARMILSNTFDANTLAEVDLDIDTMEIFLILTGSSLPTWLETANAVTGLYPFMCMAGSRTYNANAVTGLYPFESMAAFRIYKVYESTELYQCMPMAGRFRSYKMEEVYEFIMMSLSCIQSFASSSVVRQKYEKLSQK